uniref:Uncharacterized protein n=1 Tax=Arion vulgaris TaxID=1028688 RepID=A0A0B6ZWC1_9EUPU
MLQITVFGIGFKIVLGSVDPDSKHLHDTHTFSDFSLICSKKTVVGMGLLASPKNVSQNGIGDSHIICKKSIPHNLQQMFCSHLICFTAGCNEYDSVVLE